MAAARKAHRSRGHLTTCRRVALSVAGLERNAADPERPNQPSHAWQSPPGVGLQLKFSGFPGGPPNFVP